MPARILAIVLNYNNVGLTLEAVAAARAIDYPDCDLVVVDNGSTDESVERLREAHPDVELVEHTPNEGISGGFNVGLRVALERGFDIALLISNDVEVAPDIAAAVADALERDASVGVVAPLSYYADFEGARDVIWAVGGRLPWTRGTGYHVGRMEPDVGQFAEPFEVDYAPGAAWAIRVETLREIGVLSDAIFFAGEDVDFCLRARSGLFSFERLPRRCIALSRCTRRSIRARCKANMPLDSMRSAERLPSPIEPLEAPGSSSEGVESAAKYRGLLEAAPDAMVVVGETGDIVLLNVQAEKQFGYRRDELVGQPIANIIPEGFAERLIADGTRSAAEALSQQIGTGIELSGRRKDGSEFPIEIMLSPLTNADGVLVTAAIRNITVRKAAEAHLTQTVDELRRSNEELAHFAYVASHDLQEPLRMVSSYTQLLSNRYGDQLDSEAQEFIAFAVDGANRMQRLIQDLLAFSRIGTQGLELVATSADDALDRALIDLRGAIEESGAVVTRDPLPVVLADPVQLSQLFQNVIGNGIKYQDTHTPQIHVSVAAEGREKWAFSIRDNGIGIAEEYFERIFGMFQRLHGRGDYAGTGIGLAICRKIVERHGGTISVSSNDGEGTTFRFTLSGSRGSE